MKKRVIISILFVVILLAIVRSARARNEQISYDELLRKMIMEKSYGITGEYRFLSPDSGWNPPGPGSNVGYDLRDPNAVPFLLNVLQNGPDWSADNLPEFYKPKADMLCYVARCYAAVCLGCIRDSRALNPLIEVLNDTNIEPYKYGNERTRRGEYNLRAHTAFALGLLNDRKAVEPLIKSLRQDGFVECIYALSRLQAVTAVPAIVQVASERDMFVKFPSIHACLAYIMKVKFTFRIEGKDPHYQSIEQFPELGTMHYNDLYRKLWQHWVKTGDKYAREQFEEYYPQWKAALKDKPNARSLHRFLEKRMLKGGVAVVPRLITEIEKGDNSLIPVASELTKPRIRSRIKVLSPKLQKNATRYEALEWWKKNKQKWTVFQSKIPEK